MAESKHGEGKDDVCPTSMGRRRQGLGSGKAQSDASDVISIVPPIAIPTMAHITRASLRLSAGGCSCFRIVTPAVRAIPFSRGFRSSSVRPTDGVFKELTAQRVKTPWIEALRKKQAEDQGQSKASGAPSVPKERQLTPKRMDDSYHSVVLPLAQDPWLLDTYLNSSGHIRLGTIFMDLDALSGVIAYKHTGDDVTTVTASCDRIVINHPLTEICDLELSGRVTYATGRSSMEISMQVAKVPKEGEKLKNEDVLIHCTFTMVSLDPITKR